ncbi:transposase, partial [Candidatus Thiosymbion oneisti]
PASQCQDCPLKAVCLPDSGAPRSIYRSEHAQVVETHRQRMAEQGATRMRQRAGLVEHPFGPSSAGSVGITSWCVASRRSALR